MDEGVMDRGVMDTGPGSDLLVDVAALSAALHRLAPLAGELDAILAEVDAIIGDLRRECSGHHTGVVFDVANTASVRVTETELTAVRAAVLVFSDNLARGSAEFGAVDTTAANELGLRRC